MHNKFTVLLMEWHLKENNRHMPWKGEKDPYKVWLSEVILQQTRVEQGWSYYEKFIKRFPTVHDLAAAEDEETFKLWEGLGYYTRCKNLLFTARFIVKEYNGKFPDSYENIAALKGIGSYTASAISSFCFDLPYAVVDGNVFRVLSRVFGIALPIDSTEGKKYFQNLAAKVLDKSKPGIFNQAIMDFGATVCKPLPLCSSCLLNKICVAYKKSLVNTLPVKEKVLQKKMRWFSYFILEAEGKFLVRKRTANDIWQNLFEFYLVETESNPLWNKNSVTAFVNNQFNAGDFAIANIAAAASQQLTHQHIKGYFITLKCSTIPRSFSSDENQWLQKSDLAKLPFPKFINQHIDSAKNQSILF